MCCSNCCGSRCRSGILGAILEVLVEAAQQSKNVVHLVESVRQSLGRGLVHPLLDSEGGLKVLVLEQGLEGSCCIRSIPRAQVCCSGDGVASGRDAFGLFEAAGGICETPNRGSLCYGIARASMSESSAISLAAMAGAVSA